MNKYFKLMSAALAVTALASCSDNLDFDKQDLSSLKKGEMLATIDPLQDDVNTRVAVVPGGKVVWADDDEVRVYSFDKLTFNAYKIATGVGTDKATVKPVDPDATEELTGEKYAVAQPEDNKDVRISATKVDGQSVALLQAKIPYEYEWATVQANGEDAYKLASPYWGKVLGEDPFSCNFHALTAYLKLDLADIPAGTKSIMITTHEDITFGPIEDPNDPGATVLKGGANEPLSGNFEAVLIEKEDGTSESKLVASQDLNGKDYFRINFDESQTKQDKLFYIPVIAQKYQKLYVIAVTEYGKSKYAIRNGEILKVYDNEEFKVGVAKSASLGALIEFDAADGYLELSNQIALAYDGKHTVRVLVDGDFGVDGDILIASNTEKKNNVEIIFADAQTGAISFREAEASIMGWMVNWGTGVTADPAEALTYDLVTENGARFRNVSALFNGATNVAFHLPTSYIDICTKEDITGRVNILAAKSKNLAKPLSPARDVSTGKISANDAKDAPIVIHSIAKAAPNTLVNFNAVFVYPSSASSAIYVYNPETQITELGIASKTPGALRLTDALVNMIAYENTISGGADLLSVTTAANIYTDGRSAVKQLVGGGNNVKVQADWTGRGLTVAAVQNGYDQRDIYTAAQLQGVGLALGSGNGATNEYKIADQVTDMWLGGSDYPWIGASMKVLTGVDNFAPLEPEAPLGVDIVIDGNYKGLYNMVIDIDDPYYADPHSCCTSCMNDELKLTEDLGLIRDILTTGKATVKNFRLNDALIDSKPYKIPNAGSLVGRIEANGGSELRDNETSNVRVSNIGGNAGGHVGVVTTTLTQNTKDPGDDVIGAGDIIIMNSVNKKVNAETKVTERFVETVGSNAGGLVGAALAEQGLFRAGSDVVDILWVTATDGSNVGGIAGQAKYGKTASYIQKATVTVPVLKATEFAKEETSKTTLNVNSGNNVGGLVGYLWNENIARGADNIFSIRNTNTVTVKTELTAKNQFAGGLIGKAQMLADGLNDDGLKKAVLMIAKTNAADVASDINVNVESLTANNGFAGGLVAKSMSGYVWILDEAVPNVSNVSVTLGSLNTAFAGAGVIGENTDYVTIQADDKDNEQLTVSVSAWNNTWAGENKKGEKFDEGFAAIDAATLQKLCGSFAHIIGHQNENFDIYPAFVTLSENGISDTTKKALFFPKHTDATNTMGDPSDKFWGDEKHYVGFSNKTGTYKVNGTLHADQIYNYRKQY